MSQKVQVLLVDDIDGTEAAGTVEFGLDGQGYVMELSAANDKALRDALARYIDAGRRVTQASGKKTRGRQPSAATLVRDRTAPADGAERRTAIRAWARTQPQFGTIPERGRISAAITRAYDDAH